MDVQLSPFESLLAEYGPDRDFGFAHYREAIKKYGVDYAFTTAVEYYRARFCKVRELKFQDGSSIPWIDDGTGVPRGNTGLPVEITGPVCYVGSRRQCAAFIAGRRPEPTWIEEMGL